MTMSSTVSMRRLSPMDAPAVLAAFQSDPEMSRQGQVTSLAESEKYIAQMSDTAAGMESWAVTIHDQLVGLVCVNVDRENLNGWFSYWMTQSTRGQRITSRSAATVANWALTVRRLERLELGHRVNNPASGAVAKHAGFVHEGTERAKFLVNGKRIDVLTYGRLRTDAAPAFDPLPMIGA